MKARDWPELINKGYKMTDKQVFFVALVVIVLGVVLVGLVGGDCVKECESRGNSQTRCYQVCRP